MARLGALALFALLIGASPVGAAEGDAQIYKTPTAFLTEVFGTAPKPAVLWLTGDIKAQTKQILGHAYPSLRVRYWRQGERTVWILDEIGKDHPITAGFIVRAGRLEATEVLVFRESRGWEIRHAFFTKQFQGVGLTGDGALDKGIDGISGATLSVSAMDRMARLALYLNTQAR